MAENRIGGLAEFGILGNFLADIENMSRENMSRENVSRENVSRENVSRENVSRENLSRENVSRENGNYLFREGSLNISKNICQKAN